MARFWRTASRFIGQTPTSGAGVSPALLIAFWCLRPEPHISCNIAGSAEFLDRDPGGAWVTRHISRGDSFMIRSRTPYEVSFRPLPGEELETISLHLAVEPF